MTGIALPAWLEAPPERLRRPPVVSRAQGLPFEELDWPNFERLILHVVRADGAILDCQVYGIPGQAQHGIDLLAALASAPTDQGCFQCKKVESFGADDANKAVLKFEQGPWVGQAKEFTLCVAPALESTQVVEAIAIARARLALRNIRLNVWDGSKSGALNTRLKALPEIVDDFFGREWVRIFNGEEVADGLGERLDGIDFGALRGRLAELYATIFAQHDPGLRADLLQNTDYLERYVPSDVVENTTLDGLERRVSKQTVSSRDVSSQGAAPVRPETGGEEHDETRPVALVLEAFSARRAADEWLHEQNNCVILGDPGHGKSALLRHLALTLTRADFKEGAPLNPSHLHRLPVWLSFARFAAAVAENSSANIEEFFARWLNQYGYGDVQTLFRRALRTSEFIVLVDGLDEAASAAAGLEALDRLITFGRSHRAIVICTSRPRSFSALPVPSAWPSATLAPLNDNQIKELATRWFAILEGSAGTESAEARRARALPRGEAFAHAIKANPRTQELARNPLLCQALIEMFRLSHRLPEARVRAYAEIIELFLRRHPQARAHAGFAGMPATLEGIRDTDLKDVLVHIAQDTQARGVGITSRERCVELCVAYLEDEVEGLGLAHADAKRRAPEIIETLIGHFGILIERAPGDVSFVHLSLQEFLAAEGLTSKPEEEQLNWLRHIALQPRSRECLISWFGIHGERGRKPLAARAVQTLAVVAGAGEWERLQILALCAELACTDLGLPVGDARHIVAEAVHELEHSPFPTLRSELARYITVGALGGAVKIDCGNAVRRWVPARSRFERARVLRALRTWKPADDLETTLRRGLLDEHMECRRAAAETLASTFGADSNLLRYLTTLANSHVRPEVRAAALRGLAQRSEWLEAAQLAAERNIGSQVPELLLECAAIRVRSGLQTKDDLRRLRHLWFADLLDYGLGPDLAAVIATGWPVDVELREYFLEILRRDSGTADFPLPLEYLLRNYPGDEEIARILADLFARYEFHFLRDPTSLWKLLRAGFAGHPIIVPAVRAALIKYAEKYKAILWHPTTIPAYLVVADNGARDELIAAYAAADLHSRRWIGVTLVDGWALDPVVLEALQRWALGGAAMAAPLAAFAKQLRPSESERQRWLENLVRNAEDQIVAGPIDALLAERPDEATRVLARAQLNRPGLWYYNRVEIEAKLAASYPSDPESRLTLRRVFTEIDGPPISIVVSAYENDAEVRRQLLAAGIPAPVDVRLAVGSVLLERGGPVALIEHLTPSVLAEETGAVRSSGLIARARASRNEPSEAEFLDMVNKEARAIGTYMDVRRPSGLAALLEVGQLSGALAVLAEESDWSSRWVYRLEPDVIGLRTLLEHWHELEPELVKAGLKRELPLEELIEEGYGALLERVPTVRASLDALLQSMRPERRRGYHLELLARRLPKTAALRKTLIRELRSPLSQSPFSGRSACLAAQLLSQHFGGEEDAIAELLVGEEDSVEQLLGEQPQEPRRVAPGVLGHLVGGWPASAMAFRARATAETKRLKWPARDRLLCACTWGESVQAENAARELVAERYLVGFFSPDNAEALRIWAKADCSKVVLARWRGSSEGDEAITGLALAAEGLRASELDMNELRAAFNRVFIGNAPIPVDGVNPLSGRVVPWAQAAYTVIANAHQV